MTHFSLLADLINLNIALKDDRGRDVDDRKQRDRNTGLELQSLRTKPESQLRAWLHMQFPDAPGSQGQAAARFYHVLCMALVVAGVIAGWGLASVVLFYDGKQPINIVNALVVLVLPQMLLLLIWIGLALPFRLPFYGSLGTIFGFLNPGRIAGYIAGLLASKNNEGLDILWGSGNALTMSATHRWLFSFWSQLFAVSFNLGLLAKAFFLISFSDMAFVWSTTLTISNDSFHQWLTLLSTPWSMVFTEAVPGAELVANSRYYRLDDGNLSSTLSSGQAVVLGQWWPFLIAAISCYGLLPRLVTLSISWYRFRYHLHQSICHLPGAAELLARMNSPLISSAAKDVEEVFNPVDNAQSGKKGVSQYTLSCVVIDWSGACFDEQQIRLWCRPLGIEVQEFQQAGGRRSMDEDSELVASLCAAKPEGVAILVKAWEPPMLEFLDFVRTIRKQCSHKIPIVILLSADSMSVSESDRQTWQVTLGQLTDPDLHLEALGSSV